MAFDREARPARPARGNKRRKVCQFCAEKCECIDYKDTAKLRRFISERSKILPRRTTGTCAMHQRELTEAIKRATEALAALKNCGNCGIYYETYTGNGKLTMTRTFPGKPLIIFISPEDGGDHAQRFIRGCATAMCLCGSDQFSPKLTWTGNAVTWKASAQPSEVANYNGTHYHLVALLDISAK